MRHRIQIGSVLSFVGQDGIAKTEATNETAAFDFLPL
jgi:hypothetical protein